MTGQQQQRLLGAILVLALIVSLAFFLINSANKDLLVEDDVVVIDNFMTLEEISDGDIEVVDYGLEASVDPHHLLAEQAPVIEEVIIEETVISKPAPQSVEKPMIVKTQPQTVTKEVSPTVIKTDKQVVEQWVLQLASFSVKANADALEKEITALGYQPKVEQSQTKSGTIYRVRIGPEQDKTLLEKTAASLQKKQGLKSQLLLYRPAIK